MLELNLYDIKSRGLLIVVGVPDIGLLDGMGVRVGTQIQIQHRYGWGGPVLLRVEDAYTIAIGKDIARQITAKEASQG